MSNPCAVSRAVGASGAPGSGRAHCAAALAAAGVGSRFASVVGQHHACQAAGLRPCRGAVLLKPVSMEKLLEIVEGLCMLLNTSC